MEQIGNKHDATMIVFHTRTRHKKWIDVPLGSGCRQRELTRTNYKADFCVNYNKKAYCYIAIEFKAHHTVLSEIMI